MKKLFRLLATILLLNITTQANLAASDDLPYVCSLGDLSFIAEKYNNKLRYTYNFDNFFIDTKTAVADKQNKTIKVWEIKLLVYSDKYYQEFPNIGYIKYLSIYDIKNNQTKTLKTVRYQCNGNIESSNQYDNPKWDDIVPNSVGEAISDNLKKHFGM